MPVLAKKNGKWVTIANYTKNTDSTKYKILTYIPTIDDLEEGEVGFYIYVPEYDELKLYVERTITEVHIPDGTSSIDMWAFYYCHSLTSITIPDSVTSIRDYSLYSPDNTLVSTLLETVIFKGTPTSISSYAFGAVMPNEDFSNLNIYVPWSEGEVANAPWGATNATIHYNTDTSSMGSTTPNTKYLETYIAIIDRSITEINKNNFPQNVISIGEFTFALCTSLTNVIIPDGVTSIGTNVFNYCTSLETVIFEGTPTSINSYAFFNCTQDTLNIYVPWSEGEVANAPWGATNATIHYNTDTSNM